MEKSMKEIKGDLSKSYSKFLDNYLKEKGDEFEKELEKQQKDFYADANPQIIYLNVGGKKFTTTVKTLQKIPGSYLDQLVDGKIPLIKDKDGYVFLDKNGAIFEYILDYLRDGELIFPDDSELKKIMKQELQEMGLFEQQQQEWKWDKDKHYCQFNSQLVFTNNDNTVTKEGQDGLAVVFGTERFEEGEYKWEIKVHDPKTYFKVVGIFDNKYTNTKQIYGHNPNSQLATFKYEDSWSVTANGMTYKLTPTHPAPKKLKNGKVVNCRYNADSGDFELKVGNQVFKANVDSEKHKVYPFVSMYRKPNKMTLTVL